MAHRQAPDPRVVMHAHTHTIRLACAVPGEVPPSYGEVERVRRRAALRTAAPPRPAYVTSPASIISASGSWSGGDPAAPRCAGSIHELAYRERILFSRVGGSCSERISPVGPSSGPLHSEGAEIAVDVGACSRCCRLWRRQQQPASLPVLGRPRAETPLTLGAQQATPDAKHGGAR